MNFIQEAIAKRNDEKYVPSLHQYCELLKEISPSIEEIAIQTEKELCKQTTFGFQIPIQCLADSKSGKAIEFSEDFIKHFTSNRYVHDATYINVPTYNKFEDNKVTVVFVGVNEKTFRSEINDQEIKFHPIKVVNIDKQEEIPSTSI